MKVSWLYASGMVGLSVHLLVISLLTSPTNGESNADVIEAVEKAGTVVKMIVNVLADLIPVPGLGAVISTIGDLWSLSRQKEDYWQKVKEKVEELCGDSINNHNLRQVEIYKGNLARLLKRYAEAPVTSDGTYYTKNIKATAISTSIMSQRYLIEAAEKPWSMCIHFFDVASIHVLILKDVAETYNSSKWWADLSTELQHYISYGKNLLETTKDWRLSQITYKYSDSLGFSIGFSRTTETAIDRLTGKRASCTVTSYLPYSSCGTGTETLGIEVSIEKWTEENIGSAIEEWENLKVKADQMAKRGPGKNVNGTKSESLPDNREMLNATKSESLLDNREILNATKSESLPDNREMLNATKSESLLDNREMLNATKSENLPDSREMLNATKSDSLPDNQEMLNATKSESLPDNREMLNAPKSESLLNNQEMLNATKSENLLDNREMLNATKSESLPDNQEMLNATKSDSLPDNREMLNTTKSESLPDNREMLNASKSKSLPENRKMLSVTKSESLPDN